MDVCSRLSHDSITGALPTALTAALNALEHLDLSHDARTAPGPAALTALTALTYLDFSAAFVTGRSGTIHLTYVSALTNLVLLDVGGEGRAHTVHNANIMGALPGLSLLTYLDVSSTMPVPTRLQIASPTRSSHRCRCWSTWICESRGRALAAQLCPRPSVIF